MHFHAEDEFFDIREGDLTFSTRDVFTASVGSIGVIPACAKSRVEESLFRTLSDPHVYLLFSPGGRKELTPSLSAVV